MEDTLTRDNNFWSFSLDLEDLKAPIMQTGVFSPQRVSKFDRERNCIGPSSESVGCFLAWPDAAFLLVFSKLSSTIPRSWTADFMSLTDIPVFRICFSPLGSQPMIAGSESTPSLFTLGSETSWTYNRYYPKQLYISLKLNIDSKHHFNIKNGLKEINCIDNHF